MFSRSRAIRRFCMGCQAGSLKGVRLCQIENCELHVFRMGKVSRKTSQKACISEKKSLGRSSSPIPENSALKGVS